jgi:hypothetical protein
VHLVNIDLNAIPVLLLIKSVLAKKLKINKLVIKMPIMTGDWCEN